MAIDPELLEVLVCPETREPVTLADTALIDEINQRIKAGAVKNHAGEPVTTALDAGLVREDRKCVYIVEDDIPNMLIDERIDLDP